MGKKFLLAIIVAGFVFLLWPTEAWAARRRPPRGYQKTAPVRRIYTRGVRSSVRFRPDRRGLLINFSDFENVVSANYTLTYTANGIPQGAGGTATPVTAGEQRELLFGTCSGGVCHWHTNITNARLVIDSKLPSGLIIRKPYRLRV